MRRTMESQLTIRIPGDLREALDRASRRTGLKSSELVRQALRSYLQISTDRQQPPAARVRHLLGSLESGVPDLAERHREYVLESLSRGR
jgi:metal-responsive CopG/Arc/MetJ family transcriptional regulator